MSVNYKPVPSVKPYLLSDKFQSFIVGPVGSTKTTASIMKIALEAKKMAPCKDGIRRSRCAVVRNTRQMLLDSTVRDFLALFPEGVAGDYHRTELRFVLRFDDVETEVLFRGLDTADDTRRLLSLQLSFAMVDEVREINPDIFAALTGRLGRYPNGMMVPHRPEWGLDEKGNPVQGCVDDNGKQLKKVWGATNPADADTYWEQYLTNADPEKIHVTIQPSGRSPDADWLQHLPSEYYEDLMVGKTEDWISVYIDGKWGRSLSGKPVFRAFNADIHVAKNSLNYIKMSTHPLLIGHDFGLTPACTISQVDPSGRLLTFAELTSDGMGELRFIREKLKPLLASKFPGMTVLVIGDPAGQQRAQTDERSVFDILKQEGFRVIPAKTNSVAARINAVDSWLTRMVDGQPAMLIDPSCKTLIQALRGGYRYKVKTNGHTDETPEKNSFSHLADGFQYACLHADHNATGQLWTPKAKEVQKVKYVWA
jgi:hypothetical protein